MSLAKDPCGTAGEAVRALQRIPVHMSYNVTVLARAGRRATVYLAPDRPAQVISLGRRHRPSGAVNGRRMPRPSGPSSGTSGSLELVKRRHGTSLAWSAACLRPPL